MIGLLQELQARQVSDRQNTTKMGSASNTFYTLDDLILEPTEQGALEIIKKIRPDWPQDQVKFKIFTSGISNKLIGCYVTSDPKWAEMVLVRFFGQKSELLIDREFEMKLIQMLHAGGHAAPLHARFGNGMCYGFLQGCCIDTESVRTDPTRRLIAEEMARLHLVDPSDSKYRLSNGEHLDMSREPMVFPKLHKWMSMIPTSFQDEAKNQKLESLWSKSQLEAELKELKSHLEALESSSVFCHNDILLNNIVYNEEKGTVRFIDYEYGAFNYEAFDIGNHFCEYAGVDEVDYSLYPDREYQLGWIRTYLECKAKLQGKDPSIVTDLDVERLYVQANKFSLLANFFWGIWALIQSSISTIDFDYLEYANERISECLRRKEEFLALEMPK